MLSSNKKKFLAGSATNLLQLLLSFSVSLVLPPFLVHRMSPAEYSAWVLILQICAYINYLEIGIQTAIGKFIAEYHSIGDTVASGKVASTAFTMLTVGGGIGIVGIMLMAFAIPYLFHSLPPSLVPQMRIGVIAIGFTTALMLPFLVLHAVFIGLQRYTVPAIVVSTGRVLSAAAMIVLLLLHGSLAQLALLVAAFNMLTAGALWYCWSRFAREEVPLHLFQMDRPVARRLLGYSGVLALWTLGSLLISGLDTTVVGRYDFAHTGYYAVAASATNVMLLMVGNVVGPLMPAVSSIQSQRTPVQLGDLLVRSTRYCMLLVCALAIPLFIGGFPLLRLWLGSAYATNSATFLAILVVANVVRQCSYPYAMMVVATGIQRSATAAPLVEAPVNLVCSLVLVRILGAAGVAWGTLIGAVVGLTTHFLVSMPNTVRVIDFRRLRLLLQGLMRPAISVVPTLLVIPLWRPRAVLPFSPLLLALWAIASLCTGWFWGLTASERTAALGRMRTAVGSVL